MIFSLSKYQRAVEELEGSGLKNKKFILYCLQNYCPLSSAYAQGREPSLGQVLAAAHESWRKYARAQGLEGAEEPLPIVELRGDD